MCSVLRPKQQTKNFTANSHLQRSFAKGEDKDRVKLISIEIIGKCFCATNNESLAIHFVCCVGNFHGFFVNWVRIFLKNSNLQQKGINPATTLSGVVVVVHRTKGNKNQVFGAITIAVITTVKLAHY